MAARKKVDSAAIEVVESKPKTTRSKTTTIAKAPVKKVGAKMASVVEAYMKANGYEADIANLAWEFNLLKDKQVNAFCMPNLKRCNSGLRNAWSGRYR